MAGAGANNQSFCREARAIGCPRFFFLGRFNAGNITMLLRIRPPADFPPSAGVPTMLHLFSSWNRDCEGISRRDFLRVGALTGLGISLPLLFTRKAALAKERHSTPDVNCILIWTRGGTSHHDTFDPKPDAPLSVRGEFSVLPTSVPGVKFTEVLPRMARELNRYALL